MRMFGWLADRQGCGAYRLIYPGVELANRGHKIALNEEMPGLVQLGGVDVLVAQRTCEPGPSGIFQRLAREGRMKCVLELDDDLWHVDPANRQAHAFYADERLKRLTANVKAADLVTVSTEPLADVVSQWNPNVVVLPNMIPAWLLDYERPSAGDQVTIGWRGGPSHSRDFGEAARPLKRVLQKYGAAVEFHAMGANYTPRVASIKGRTRHTGWVNGIADFLRLIDFDVGVVPLCANAFNDSKSDLALLELSALGIPAIVSNTGPHKRAFVAGAPCLVADNHRDFESHLIELIDNPERRIQLGKQAREWASTRTVEANAWRWEAAYQ